METKLLNTVAGIPRYRPARPRGFTFVELIAVMVLLGILSATAYARLSGTEFAEAGFRDQVAATVSYARKAAVAQRRWVQVSLAANALDLRIANDIPESADKRNFGAATSRLLVVPGTGSAHLDAPNAVTLAGPTQLWFSPAGTAEVSSGTAVYTLSGTPARTVTVDPASGHVY